jgi:putative transposase
MDYDRNNHSKFLLMYHVIFVCNYRRKALLGIENDLKNSILGSVENLLYILF